MVKLTPIQYGFAAGELTPRIYGNTQKEVYKNGVAEMLNMVPRAQGSTVSRFGTTYLADAGHDTSVRLIPFNVARGADYVVELGPFYMRVYNINGRVNIGGQELVNDPAFIREFIEWDDFSIGTGTVTFIHTALAASLNNLVGANIGSIGQKLGDINTVNLTLDHIVRGGFSGDGELHIEIGTAEGLNDVLDETVLVAGNFSFVCNPVQEANWIRFTNSGLANTSAIVSFPSFRLDAEDIELVTPYSADDLDEIQYEMISSQKRLILAHSRHPQKVLSLLPVTLSPLPNADFQLDDIDFIEPPDSWVEGNYPNVVTVYQGRLWFARTPLEPQAIWASVSGDYFNFALAESDADDSIAIELSAPGEIEWMRGQKDLMMGTDLGEHRITSSTGVITPSDIDIRQQSAYGSATLIQGQNIGDQILYVSPDRRKVRALTFDAFQQGWYSPDLTWIAEHITLGRIKEIHFLRDPGTLMICILDNGDTAICTYDRSQESLGWALFHNDSFNYVSTAIINGDVGSSALIAVKQDNGKMVLMLDAGVFGVRSDMDSVVRGPVEVGNILTGLEHLEGMIVGVKVDDAVHPDRLVIGGQISLDHDGITAIAGLKYVSRIRTLPLDVGSRGGSGLAHLKHWSKIYISLLDSALPKINGVRPPDRSPSTPMNEVEPLKNTIIQATDLGRTRPATITIEQDLPLKLEILNLLGDVGQDSI